MAQVKAPHDGKFMNDVAQGDAVKTGATLCRIAGGGVNYPVNAPCDGTIQLIHQANNAFVFKGDPLYEIVTSVTPSIT